MRRMMVGILAGSAMLLVLVSAAGANAQQAFDLIYNMQDFGNLTITESGNGLDVKFTAPNVASGTYGLITDARASRVGFQINPDSLKNSLTVTDPIGTTIPTLLWASGEVDPSGFPTPTNGLTINTNYAASASGSAPPLTGGGNPGVPLFGANMDEFRIDNTLDGVSLANIDKIGVRYQGLSNDINEGSLYLVGTPRSVSD